MKIKTANKASIYEVQYWLLTINISRNSPQGFVVRKHKVTTMMNVNTQFIYLIICDTLSFWSIPPGILHLYCIIVARHKRLVDDDDDDADDDTATVV